jgi:hypothetical protein
VFGSVGSSECKGWRLRYSRVLGPAILNENANRATPSKPPPAELIRTLMAA